MLHPVYNFHTSKSAYQGLIKAAREAAETDQPNPDRWMLLSDVPSSARDNASHKIIRFRPWGTVDRPTLPDGTIPIGNVAVAGTLWVVRQWPNETREGATINEHIQTIDGALLTARENESLFMSASIGKVVFHCTAWLPSQ